MDDDAAITAPGPGRLVTRGAMVRGLWLYNTLRLKQHSRRCPRGGLDSSINSIVDGMGLA